MTLEGETAIPGEWPVNRAGLFISEKYSRRCLFYSYNLVIMAFQPTGSLHSFPGQIKVPRKNSHAIKGTRNVTVDAMVSPGKLFIQATTISS